MVDIRKAQADWNTTAKILAKNLYQRKETQRNGTLHTPQYNRYKYLLDANNFKH